MIRDQASQLRQLMSQRQVATDESVALVAVSGGLRGVGTTTTAANLAVALARQGRRTVLVDADLQHGGRMQLADRKEVGSVADVLSGRRGVHEVLVRGPLGVQVLNGGVAVSGSLVSSAASHARLVSQLRGLAPYADVVVIDAGNQSGPLLERLWQQVDAAWIVTSDTDTAVLAGYASIKSIAQGGLCPPLHAFVNRADETRAAEVQERMAEACERFLSVRLALAGRVDQVPGDQRDSRGLIAAGSPAAWAFDKAAEELWNQLECGPRPQKASPRAMQPALS